MCKLIFVLKTSLPSDAGLNADYPLYSDKINYIAIKSETVILLSDIVNLMNSSTPFIKLCALCFLLTFPL